MSMLRCFFEKRECDISALFHGLAVSRHDEAMRHFQRHPVVALSFRGISTVSDAERAVRASFAEHAYLRHHPALSPVDRMIYRQIKRQPLSYGLFELTRLVQQAHAERAVVLVDHYDRLSSVFARGVPLPWIYSRVFVGLRDNIHVEKAVLMDRSGLAERYVQCSRVWADRARRHWTPRSLGAT